MLYWCFDCGVVCGFSLIFLKIDQISNESVLVLLDNFGNDHFDRGSGLGNVVKCHTHHFSE